MQIETTRQVSNREFIRMMPTLKTAIIIVIVAFKHVNNGGTSSDVVLTRAALRTGWRTSCHPVTFPGKLWKARPWPVP